MNRIPAPFRAPLRAAAAFLAIGTACTTRDAESVRRADSTNATSDSVHRTAAAAKAPAESAATSVAPADDPHAGRAGNATVEYLTASRLGQVADSLSRGPTTGHMLGSHRTYQYLQIRRAASGVPEVHDRWTDVTVVQAGRGTLLSGGHVTGAAAQGGGEWRGGEIVGGSRRPVGPGDLMMIPAGVPHQYEIARGDSLRYITVKVLAAPN